VPNWQSKKTELLLNYSIAKQLAETKLNHEKLKELADEYQMWDKKGEE
jgi:oligoribonuclease NrnB/cAMP/cGMP phosphodiesterase (DHH superfamily)